MEKNILSEESQYYKHETSRKKHQKIRCPYCGATSKVVSVFDKTSQFRICKNNHNFVYDYDLEFLKQQRTDYKHYEREKSQTDLDIIFKEESRWVYKKGDKYVKRI